MPLLSGKTEIRGGNLAIRRVIPAGSGWYECVAMNSMGTKRVKLNLVQLPQSKCACWRTRSKRPYFPSSGWGYGGAVDAIDFQTDGDVILQGYRLWGVKTGSASFQVTIGLYRGSTLIAERTGPYSTKSSIPTFEVHFNQVISIRADVTYTATAKITTSKGSFYMEDGMETFLYDSELWTNNKSYNIAGGATGFDLKETKLPTYYTTPFSKICLGMKVNGKDKYIVLKKEANSLYELISDGRYRATDLGRYKWKKLIPNVDLEDYCNMEGFNAMCEGSAGIWSSQGYQQKAAKTGR